MGRCINLPIIKVLATEAGLGLNNQILGLVWDQNRKRAVRFESKQANPLMVVAEFDGSHWSVVNPIGAAPPSRNGGAFAWDGNLKKVILFGGEDRADTWSWDGRAWAQLNSGALSTRSGHAMAWNPSRGRVLLFGGHRSGALVGDTWEWDGSAWSLLQVSSPPATSRAGLGWDAQRQRMMLHGGVTEGGFTTLETWLFDSQWKLLETSYSSSSGIPKYGLFGQSVAELPGFGMVSISTNVSKYSEFGYGLKDRQWDWLQMTGNSEAFYRGEYTASVRATPTNDGLMVVQASPTAIQTLSLSVPP